MRSTTGILGMVSVAIVFGIIFIVFFTIFPDIGEKILYGKHPPEKKSEPLKYSQIITSDNYECMESASIKAQGDLSKFVKEFNDCNK